MEIVALLILVAVFPILWIRAVIENRRLRRLIQHANEACSQDFRYHKNLLTAKETIAALAQEAQ